MNDIFISYSSKDREWVARLAKALEAQGYEVWWDPEILPGQHYQDVIQKALHGAKNVVAVWTADSVQSDYVKAECLWAFTKRNLISVLGKDAEIPTPFNAIQAADLRKWKGSADDPQFQRLLRGIRFAQTGEIPPQPKVERPAPKSRLGVVLAGVAAVAVAGAGVYWQQNGGFAGENPPAIAEPAKPASAPVEPKPAVTPPVAKPEAPKSYQLTVKTTPENAAITVDGNAYEAGKQWKPGTYTVKAVAEGYQPVEQTVTLKDQDAQISLTLEAIRYALTINTKPVTAKISLSGGLGYSPGMLLQPGDYVVKVEADGYQPQEKAFTIATGDETLNVELKPDHSEYEPEMVSIPAGTFSMGCDGKRDDVEGGCDDGEKPAHKVTLKAFKLAKTETTVGQYMACVDASGCPPPEWKDKDAPDYYKSLGNGLTDQNYPIVGVSWDNANAYAKWLSKETGKNYRLPSEAEWEYAARGGSDTAYPWGNAIGEGNANCNSACGDKFNYTSPVSSFAANGYGLHDMNGNVWEWVQDRWHGDYKGAPVDGSVWESGDSASRVLRGGSWNYDAQSVRSADRGDSTPGDRNGNSGFRLASGQ